MLGVPFLPEYKTKAKLNFLASISSSEDPLIQDLSSSIIEQLFLTRQCFTDEVKGFLEHTKNSISSIPGKTLGKTCKSVFKKEISRIGMTTWVGSRFKTSFWMHVTWKSRTESGQGFWMGYLPDNYLSF